MGGVYNISTTEIVSTILLRLRQTSSIISTRNKIHALWIIFLFSVVDLLVAVVSIRINPLSTLVVMNYTLAHSALAAKFYAFETFYNPLHYICSLNLAVQLMSIFLAHECSEVSLTDLFLF